MKNNSIYSLKTGFMIALAGLVFLFIGLPNVNAFANTFLEDKTMELDKGETGEYCVYLQNTGEEELTQIIKIFEGEEYIKNLNEVTKEFKVPVGTVSDDLPICIQVKLPRGAEKDDKYLITYGVTSPVTQAKEGMVSFAPVQIRDKFYITEGLEKKEKDEPATAHLILALSTVITILIVLYSCYRKTKNRKPKNGAI